MLLQSLRSKFQWVMDQAKKLGLPPPPALVTFGMTAEEKKRKRTQFLKEAFVTEDIKVDGMNMNLIPPPNVMPIEGLVINEPESGIFFMNRNTDIAFQRESEFHLTPTIQLIRIQNQIKVDSEIADELFRKMIYVIKARSDCTKARETVMKGLSECKASESNIRRIRVKDIVKEVEDYLKTYSSAGMDISWWETQYHLKARRKKRELRVIIDCDEDVDEGFAFFNEENESGRYLSEKAKEETAHILRKARRRKRKYNNATVEPRYFNAHINRIGRVCDDPGYLTRIVLSSLSV
ncbi:heat shock 70 kDa protein BIP1 [Tanacetum coccineum]